MGDETDADDEDRRVERARDALLNMPRRRRVALVLTYHKWHLKQGFIRWVMERPRRWVPIRIVHWAMREHRLVY